MELCNQLQELPANFYPKYILVAVAQSLIPELPNRSLLPKNNNRVCSSHPHGGSWLGLGSWWWQNFVDDAWAILPCFCFGPLFRCAGSLPFRLCPLLTSTKELLREAPAMPWPVYCLNCCNPSSTAWTTASSLGWNTPSFGKAPSSAKQLWSRAKPPLRACGENGKEVQITFLFPDIPAKRAPQPLPARQHLGWNWEMLLKRYLDISIQCCRKKSPMCLGLNMLVWKLCFISEKVKRG